MSSTLPLNKKNNHYVRAAGAKKELSGIGGLMMSDHGQPIKAQHIGELMDNKTGHNAARNSRIGLDHGKCPSILLMKIGSSQPNHFLNHSWQ